MKKIQRVEIRVSPAGVQARVMAPAARGAIYTAHAAEGRPGEPTSVVVAEALAASLASGRGVKL